MTEMDNLTGTVVKIKTTLQLKSERDLYADWFDFKKEEITDLVMLIGTVVKTRIVLEQINYGSH